MGRERSPGRARRERGPVGGARGGGLERPSLTLGHQVFASLGKKAQSTSELASGSTAASRSLRQAASVRWRGRPVHRSCGCCQPRALASALKALGGTSTTDSPAADNLWARCRPRPPAFSPPPNDARKTVSLRAFEGSQAGAVLQEGSTLNELAGDFVHRCTTATEALWGSTPIRAPSCSHAPPSRSDLRLACVKDTPTLGCAHTSFESLRTPFSTAGRKQRTSQPILWVTGRW
jgi:hypothetical protein